MSINNERPAVRSRYNWIFESDQKGFDKQALIDDYIMESLIRTQEMFEYRNLPDTLPKKDLELILQVQGSATIAEVDGNIYAFRSGLGGKPNPYYLPTLSIIANPALDLSKSYVIDKDCVVILNDALYHGILPIITRNAGLLAECDISFKYAAINSRIPALVGAPDDTVKEAADEFFKQIVEGKNFGAIADDSFIGRLNSYNYNVDNGIIKNIIELKQYIWGSFYQQLGVQANFNMKREAINEAEASLSLDLLIPLCDQMLEQRKIGVEKVNRMFGTSIEVDFSSVWKDLRRTKQLGIEVLKSEIVKNESNVKEQIVETVVENKEIEEDKNDEVN